MTRKSIYSMVFSCALIFGNATLTHSVNLPASHNPEHGKSAFRFTENKGQVQGFDGSAHPEVKFAAGGADLKIFVMEDGLAYQFMKLHKGKQAGPTRSHRKRNDLFETFRVDMVLENAAKGCAVTTEGKSTDFENHYTSSSFDVRHYQRITFHDVYPGIDWVLSSSGGNMKYDFVVRPGANPSDIKLRFIYHEAIALDTNGDLAIRNSLGSIAEKKPVSYQGATAVDTRFRLENDVVSFEVGSYDRAKTLVIDPLVIWGSYYGGNDMETGRSCTSDAAGNIYLAGETSSQNNIAAGGHQTSHAGYDDAFLVKFDALGSRLWATYYGGSMDDLATSCVIDASGFVYLAGFTESASNIASGGHQNVKSTGLDLFLVKFNSIGGRVWATYYGGNSDELFGNCVTDASGNVYLCGTTLSTGNIATASAYQTVKMGDFDALLVKFNSSGVRQWGTYFGGYYSDWAEGCAVDPSGNVYICGNTDSYNYISSAGAHQSSLGGNTDGFLAKFNASGARLWSTYYGSSYFDNAYACATDASGNVYLTGSSSYANSGDITTFGAYLVNNTQSQEAFLAKFSPAGVRAWGTFLGYSNYQNHDGCTVDAGGYVYVAGSTLMKFSAGGTHEWGYAGLDVGSMRGICNVTGDRIAVAGTTSYTVPAIANGHQTVKGGMDDAYMAVLSTCASPEKPGNISGPAFICGTPSGVLTYSVAPVTDALGYTWQLPGGWNGSSNSNTISVLPSQSGGEIRVSATGTCGAGEASSIMVWPINPPQVFVSHTGIYCQGMTVSLEANGASTYTWTGGPATQNYNVSPHFATTYTVTGTDLATSCTNSATYFLQPDTTTVFNFTISNMTANLSIRNSACSSFEWDYGNGSGSTLNSNPVVTYVNPGTYGICLKCNGLPQACIRCINITVPGNRKGGVGVSEIQQDPQLTVFPNPTRNRFTVTVGEKSEVSVLTSLGQEIISTTLAPGSSQISLEGHPAGVYLLLVKTWSGSTVAKIVRE